MTRYEAYVELLEVRKLVDRVRHSTNDIHDKALLRIAMNKIDTIQDKLFKDDIEEKKSECSDA